MKVASQSVDAKADLSGFDVLILGKGALTVDGPAPDVMRVRDGLKVIVFEQTAQALEQRHRGIEKGGPGTAPAVTDVDGNLLPFMWSSPTAAMAATWTVGSITGWTIMKIPSIDWVSCLICMSYISVKAQSQSGCKLKAGFWRI